MRTVSLVALTFALLAAPTFAGDLPWEPVTLGDGPATIDLPHDAQVHRDPDGFWLSAEGIGDSDLFFVWSRTPLGEDATLGRFHTWQLQAERGATIGDVGFRVDDVAYEMLAGRQAIWTLVAKPGLDRPVRSLYVHLRDDDQGHVLRVDVPLGTFHDRRGQVMGLLRGFRLPTVPEPAPDGQRIFAYEIPEAITFLGHPFLEEVERANEKRVFEQGETTDFVRAQAAWLETLVHYEHLLTDRAYRAQDGAFANLALDPKFAGLHLTFHRATPYALCYVSREPPDAEARAALTARGETLQALYRYTLDAFGEALDLEDLAAPFGGRADIGAYRSFEDGIPLVVLVYESYGTWLGASQQHLPSPWPAGRFEPRSGNLVLIHSNQDGHDTSAQTASGGARQLLYWFTRQRNRWRQPAFPASFLDTGVSAWLAAGPWLESKHAPHGRRRDILETMQQWAQAFQSRGAAYPALDIRACLAAKSLMTAVSRIGPEQGVPAHVAVRHFHHQSWAFIHFLYESEGGAYRDKLLSLVNAVLDRETGRGQAERVFARIFELDDERWEELQSEYETFLRDHLQKADLDAWEAGTDATR